MSDIDAAWVAGLFEGEGSLALRHGKSAAACVKMTDEDVIRKLHALAECGNVYGPYGHSGHPNAKPYWDWTVTRAPQLRAFLLAIEPMMGSRRRAKIAEVLRHIESNRGARSDLKECPFGHPYEQRYRTGKARICRPCHRARERRRHAAKVAAQAAEGCVL